MEKKRSKGVTVLAWAMLSCGLLFLVIFLLPLLHVKPTLANKESVFMYLIDILQGFNLTPVINVPLGLLYLLLSINILRLRNWSRIITVWLSVFIILPNAWYWFACFGVLPSEGGESLSWAAILFVPLIPLFLVSVLCLIFFTRPQVKAQFK
jgi:hypothetical protein